MDSGDEFATEMAARLVANEMENVFEKIWHKSKNTAICLTAFDGESVVRLDQVISPSSTVSQTLPRAIWHPLLTPSSINQAVRFQTKGGPDFARPVCECECESQVIRRCSFVIQH